MFESLHNEEFTRDKIPELTYRLSAIKVRVEDLKTKHPIQDQVSQNISFLNITGNLLASLGTDLMIMDRDSKLDDEESQQIVQENFQTFVQKIKALETYCELLEQHEELAVAEMGGQEGHYADLQKEVDAHHDKSGAIETYIERLVQENSVMN
ncbi:MAG: hypothetical protein V4519_03050 [Patescibacteria group bacterium]